MHYLLNSAVLTAFGTYAYEPLTPAQADQWLHAGIEHAATCGYGMDEPQAEEPLQPCTCPKRWQSTIGYEETARALEQLCGLEPESVPLNRIAITMDVGDSALVFRLKLPPGAPRIDPQNKGQITGHLDAGHWELGLLRRRD